MRALLLLLLMCLITAPCYAGTVPSVAARVFTADGLTAYEYTVTNSLTSGAAIGTFAVFMPEAAARAVTGFICIESSWANDYSFRGDSSMWVIAPSDGIVPGATKRFILTTPVLLSTSYTFRRPFYSGNWGWNGYEMGTTSLPVPVPEPSSLLALTALLAPVAGLALGRRK